MSAPTYLDFPAPLLRLSNAESYGHGGDTHAGRRTRYAHLKTRELLRCRDVQALAEQFDAVEELVRRLSQETGIAR